MGKKRHIIMLSGQEQKWEFALQKGLQVQALTLTDAAQLSYREIRLPHDWAVDCPFDRDMERGMDQGFRDRWGIGWYRTRVNLAKDEQMDPILAYLRLMLKKASEKGVSVTRENFVKLGKSIEYYPGVEEWFSRIDEYGKENGVTIEHYVISSGLREIIEGSSIYKHFKKVYACEFLYDENQVAAWPKLAVNYTNKTQFLFRINKGVLEINEDRKLNEYIKEEDRRIPFRNMIYIGDGLTDVPCMKLVKVNKGQWIKRLAV